jgi:hypothetical protein
MGTYSGPPSASDGLVLYLDAANSASYSGSGNTFYNLVNASIGGSIVGYASTPIDNTQIKSLTFDGSNDFISVGSLGTFYTQGTISFWMKSLDITANYRNPFATNYNGSNTNVLRFEQGEGLGAFKCWFGDPSGTIASLSYSSISANTWYNVVLTWNQSATTVTGYMNGVLDVNNSSWARWPTSFVNVGIGLGYNSRYFLGNLGQVSLYNRALSASEIFQNYNASKKRYFPEENIVTNGLILNIDPSKPSSYAGSGNTIYDLSGSNYNFTLDSGITFDGLKSGSLYFDGTKKAITNFTWPNNFTVDITFKLYANSGYFFSRIISTGNNDEFEFAVGQSGLNEIKLLVNGWVNTSQYITADVIETYTITRSPSTSNIYRNGILIFTTSVTTTVSTSLNINLACRHSNQGQNTRINIYNLKIYNKVLTATEIEQNFNALRGRYNI